MSRGGSRRVAAVTVIAIVFCVTALAQPGERVGVASDEEFITSLGQGSGPVDRKRFAKVLFGVAATLDAGRTSVRLLHVRVLANDKRESLAPLFEGRYDAFVAEVGRFRGTVSELVDDPESLLLLHQAIYDGQRACWQLDLHNRLAQTYGADLMSVLAQREACSRFRSATFQPRVEAIVREALVESKKQREEIRLLRDELADLEELLGDLREIDASP